MLADQVLLPRSLSIQSPLLNLRTSLDISPPGKLFAKITQGVTYANVFHGYAKFYT